MKHRLINYCIALAILLVMVAIQHLDARSFETAAQKAKREDQWARQLCLRMYGAEVVPEWSEATGMMICRSRKGEVLAWGPSK